MKRLVLLVTTVALVSCPDPGAEVTPAGVIEAQDPAQVAAFDAIFQELPSSPGPHTLTLQQVNQLLDYAEERGWNFFDLLNEGIPYLEARESRVHILGDDLRKAGLVYRMGDHRVDVFFPLPKIREIQIGKTLGPDQGAADVFLTQPYSQFLELGDFFFEPRYGFRTIRGKSLAEAYGIKLRIGIFNLDMSHIERVPDPTGGVDPNFIAMHFRFLFFSHPKRWHIDPIRKH